MNGNIPVTALEPAFYCDTAIWSTAENGARAFNEDGCISVADLRWWTMWSTKEPVLYHRTWWISHLNDATTRPERWSGDMNDLRPGVHYDGTCLSWRVGCQRTRGVPACRLYIPVVGVVFDPATRQHVLVLQTTCRSLPNVLSKPFSHLYSVNHVTWARLIVATLRMIADGNRIDSNSILLLQNVERMSSTFEKPTLTRVSLPPMEAKERLWVHREWARLLHESMYASVMWKDEWNAKFDAWWYSPERREAKVASMRALHHPSLFPYANIHSAAPPTVMGSRADFFRKCHASFHETSDPMEVLWMHDRAKRMTLSIPDSVYVDFEWTKHQELYLVGIYSKKTGYRAMWASDLSSAAQRRLVECVHERVKDEHVVFYHAELSFWTSLCQRLGLAQNGDDGKSLGFGKSCVDLRAIFWDGPTIVRNCFTTRLKEIAQSFRDNGLLECAPPEECATGMASLAMAEQIYAIPSPVPSPLREKQKALLEEYNAFDCQVLSDIHDILLRHARGEDTRRRGIAGPVGAFVDSRAAVGAVQE